LCLIKVKIYKTIILPVVLYGCETWSLTLREKHRLTVFEHRVLRRIFGPKRDEVTDGGSCTMRSFIFCTPPQILLADQIKENEVGGTCGTHGSGEECVQGFDGKAQRKRLLGRPRRRWENGIRMNLRETGWGSVDWIQLAQDRDRWRALANTVMNLWVLAPRS
jgi:hypothetical protein